MSNCLVSVCPSGQPSVRELAICPNAKSCSATEGRFTASTSNPELSAIVEQMNADHERSERVFMQHMAGLYGVRNMLVRSQS